MPGGAPGRKKTISLQDKKQLASFTKYESFFEVNGMGTDLFQFELIFVCFAAFWCLIFLLCLKISSPSKRPLETRFNFDLCTLYSKLPTLVVTFMTKDRTRFFFKPGEDGGKEISKWKS